MDELGLPLMHCQQAARYAAIAIECWGGEYEPES